MKQIKNWEKATQELAEAFARKYYTYEEDEEEYFNADMYWVGDEIGDCFIINDDFYSVDRMLKALKLNATYDQLRDFAQYEISKKKKRAINFENFVKLDLKLDDVVGDKININIILFFTAIFIILMFFWVNC